MNYRDDFNASWGTLVPPGGETGWGTFSGFVGMDNPNSPLVKQVLYGSHKFGANQYSEVQIVSASDLVHYQIGVSGNYQVVSGKQYLERYSAIFGPVNPASPMVNWRLELVYRFATKAEADSNGALKSNRALAVSSNVIFPPANSVIRMEVVYKNGDPFLTAFVKDSAGILLAILSAIDNHADAIRGRDGVSEIGWVCHGGKKPPLIRYPTPVFDWHEGGDL